jgi:hypothetical protein
MTTVETETSNTGERTVVLKKISEHFWMLQSDDGLVKLTWFGATRGEVLGRFNAYIRSVDLDRIRYKPRVSV